MMRQMRENTKWIMLATALAFVALMVFEWGMDITGQSAGGLGEIGRVNGTPIFYEDYLATYRNLYDRIQLSQEDPITSQQNREIEDAAFNDIVDQILIQQELGRRGIRVTDAEVRQASMSSPPAELQQYPLFVTAGQFDLQKYQTYLSSPQANLDILLYVESYYRNIIPRGKLMRQVTAGLYPTDEELWERWREQNEAVVVRYIPLNPSVRIPDEQVEVTAAEVQDYYDEHLDEFEILARASVKAVVLDKRPTPEDTLASLQRATEVRQEILDGADFAQVAERESRDPQSAPLGGDMGVFGQGYLVAPLDSVVFALPPGELSEPLQTEDGIHLIEVKERWGEDSVSVRQIVLPMGRTDDSEIALLTLADSLEDLSEGRTLTDAAQILGLPVQDGQITQEVALIAGAGQVGEGMDWAFEEAAPGDVSPVFENSQAFYALELVSLTPGGTLPLENAETTIRALLLDQKKLALAQEQAAELVQRIRAGTSLADVAQEAGLDVRDAGPFSRMDAVPGLGARNAAVGAAFGLAPGQVSDPVVAVQNVFILELIGREAADSTAWAEQSDFQRQLLGAQLQQERVDLWLEGLRATARIVDRRAQVLQPADEDQALPSGGAFGF